jgi:NTE family protein
MKIGLALSGGGALGAAHIGVLDCLAAAQVHPHCIGGTSSGAIIGLLYAAGGIPAIDGFLGDLTERGIVNPVGHIVLKTADRIFVDVEQALRKQVKQRTFADLPIPFFCVATDIVTGELVQLDHGDPVAAVLASAAYPGVFPVQHVAGHYLVDGGLTRNLPADLLRARGAGFLIGSSLYCLSPLTSQQQHGRMSRLLVAARALEIIEKDRVKAQIDHCDFCFTPPVETYKWYDFDRVPQIRTVGRAYAEERADALRTLLDAHAVPEPAAEPAKTWRWWWDRK